jgi:hypothetical protein
MNSTAGDMKARLIELRKEVEAAEAAEKIRSSEAELADAKARMEGKAFIYNQPTYDGIMLSLVLYKKVTRNSSGNLETSPRSLWIVRYDKPKNSYEIHRNKVRYPQTISSVTSTLLHWREIPVSAFNELWRSSADLGEAFMKWVATTIPVDPAAPVLVTDIAPTELSQPDDDHLSNPLTDIPHLQLSAGDSSVLPRRFMLPGYRYVLSPSSISEGLTVLRDKQNQLEGSNHLYEACDMRYLASAYEQINRLRTMLTA